MNIEENIPIPNRQKYIINDINDLFGKVQYSVKNIIEKTKPKRSEKMYLRTEIDNVPSY